MTHSNPYVQQTCDQYGMTPTEVFKSSSSFKPMTFPCVIHGRTFETHNEYINAMYDYLAAI